MHFNASCSCLRLIFGMPCASWRLGRFLSQFNALRSMAKKRILVDESIDMFGKKLQEMGYDAERVKILKEQDPRMKTDFWVMTYAKENGMMIITKDQEMGKDCSVNGIDCVAITDEEVFEKIILPKVNELQGEPDGKV